MQEPSTPPAIGHVRAVSYNVRRCVGLDGRESVDRIAAVLEPESADVIALQEVLRHEGGLRNQASILATRLGMELVFAEAMPQGPASYGIALLLRRPPDRIAVHPLPRIPPAEPRVALEVSLGALTVVTTHWGLRRQERAAQAAEAGKQLPASGPLLMMGDFNCTPGSPPAKQLRGALGLEVMPGRLRTFPSPWPVVALDYALARGVEFVSVRAVRGRVARVASDHLPIVVEVVG